MSDKKNSQGQTLNGNGPTTATDGSSSNPSGVFRTLVDAMAICSKHESFYTKAETTATDLIKTRSQLEERNRQYKEKVSSYLDLLQTTRNNFNKVDQEKQGLKAENEKLHKEIQSHTAKLNQQKQTHAGLQLQIQEQKQALKDKADTLKQEKARSADLDTNLRAKGDECKQVNAKLEQTCQQLLKWGAYESKLCAIDANL